MPNTTNNHLSPVYTCQPIRGVALLARSLGVSEQRLRWVANHADSLYRTVRAIEKEDGTKRQTFDAQPLLKNIQRRIKDKILSRVQFPPYLHGSLKAHSNYTNALVHKGARICITEDIENYFPSISAPLVQRMWRNLFGFDDEVAILLTALTVKASAVPQGAVTSSFIANLALWEHEPKLVRDLEAKGYRYSRFVDDITVSSAEVIPPEEKTWIVSAVFGMLRKLEFRPKRKKHKITSSRDAMVATKIILKDRSVGLSTTVRANIRAAVFQLEQRAAFGEHNQELKRLLASASCRVGRLARFHAIEAHELKMRIAVVRERFERLESGAMRNTADC